MNRWLSVDQRYEGPRGLTDYVRRPAFKWIGLLVAVVCGVMVGLFLRHRLAAAVAKFEPDTAGDDGPTAPVS